MVKEGEKVQKTNIGYFASRDREEARKACIAAEHTKAREKRENTRKTGRGLESPIQCGECGSFYESILSSCPFCEDSAHGS